MAEDTTEGSGHGLQTAAHTWALARPGWLDSAQLLLALAAFWHGALLLDVQVHQTATGRADTERERAFVVSEQSTISPIQNDFIQKLTPEQL